jgi:benzoyl-CoA reductase/2-hydroxyglutaryl-CoA dehydratase subunit BcrC/BadD/HgdB
MQEKKNVPYIAVETDYYQGDAEQLSTRMGAFIEMMA